MGLDEFLIPTGPSPGRPALPAEGLDDVLVAPPSVPEPSGPPDGGPDAPRAFAPPTPPPAASPTATPPATAPSRSIEVEPSVATELPLIVPPTIDEPPATATDLGPAEEAWAPSASRPPAPAADLTAEASARLDGFLAAAPAVEEPPSAWRPAPDEEDAILAPADLVPPTVAAPTPEAVPRAPASPWASPTLDAVSSLAPPAYREPSPFVGADAGARPEFGDATPAEELIGRLEDRIALAIERLERAAERLAAPPAASIAARPRAFRGRLDG